MRHDENDINQAAADQITLLTELSDEDLAMVSGGCRKAGGDQETGLPEHKSIIAI